jgi:hypothetical protein
VGERTLLVVLTGMGRDGAEGARAVRAAGGRILCEAAESCTVYGMPRAVVEDGWPTSSCRWASWPRPSPPSRCLRPRPRSSTTST